MAGSHKNWKDQKFNSLTFKQPSYTDRHGNCVWELLCDCGETTYAIPNQVVKGRIKTCGHSRGSKEFSVAQHPRKQSTTNGRPLPWTGHLVINESDNVIMGIYGGALIQQAWQQVYRIKRVNPTLPITVVTKFLSKRPEIGEVMPKGKR